ncbi:hypothetical protein M408DRAFT_24399 [Serendipita vermifera MAFF 305830]|uniref:PNPLA domain-containing protein n=1 Tax=Serendipita vermifera MAFF 305830 TaxID=933852 RepID=A0A0C2WME7_SERVB|nr:hypothetical protein M408DRAFT_24399 [Serendipita vermifera MAFF 305830]
MQFLHPEGDGVRILSLDGGDIRCFSQLLILEELMHRLEYDYERPVRPCEFFHSITGVGAGGVNAILLGVLGMTVAEATEVFIGICKKVFAADTCDERLRSERLVLATQEVLDRLGVPHTTRLAGDIDRTAGCHVAICYSSASIPGCRMFRNYKSKWSSYNPTIVEAVRASWATPGLFSSVFIGNGPQQEEIISAVNGFNNPTLQAVQEAREVYGTGKAVSALLSLGNGKSGPISVHSEGFIHRTVQQTEITEENIEQKFGPSGVYYRLSPDYTIQNESSAIQGNHLGSITSYARGYLERFTVMRLMESFLNASACTSNIDLTLRGEGRVGNLVPTAMRLSREERIILSDLKVKEIECGSPIQGCMKGTRTAILNEIHSWATDLTAPNILWLDGYPGVGKSAIATEVVDQLAALGRLGSSFFFQRQRAADLTPHALWRNVAYDLSRRHPSVRRTVILKLEEDTTSPETFNLQNIFRHFIREPLMKSTDIPEARLPVVVIDALDECGGLEGQQSTHRKMLVKTIHDWSQLPTRFKLLVTSRGENDIKRLFSITKHHHIEILAGEMVDAQSSEDIKTFLMEEFRNITAQYALSSPQTNWPDAETIHLLVYMAGGLFIWAQTVIKFISLGEPERGLNQVLEGRAKGNIDTLYDQILKASFSREEDIQDFQTVVGAIVLMKAPLSLISLAHLLSMNKSSVEHVCIRLRSVLEYHNNLRFYHQSFVDFLLNHDRCTIGFSIDQDRAKRKLALACFKVLNNELKFNICGVESSYLRNTDIPDLASKAGKFITPHLLYSSLWWVSHLTETRSDTEIFDHVRNFMHKQFLFWLEILSISKRVNLGSQMLLCLVNWIRTYRHTDAIELAYDMQKFVTTFAVVISQSVSHIYMSAVPFLPSTSIVWRHYAREYGETLRVASGGLSDWPALQLEFIGHTSEVNCVAFSPDGKRIVSGSNDETIRVWDAETGVVVAGPLQGHRKSINSVAFSPDGSRIVSGSFDKTVRVWDAETGAVVAGPFEGHSSGVSSVSFSPDGKRIVSGSHDETVRVWDAETGAVVAGPLQAHNDLVHSVAFLPDGKRIVSASTDQTVLVWNAETGAFVACTFRDHSNLVRSGAFSPDGKRIVSGSYDKTVEIWDAETGAVLAGPLQGHSDSVHSVAFSPDGKRIVSGSFDKTIRVWDSETDAVITSSFEGHSSSISSVAFSPDGKRIVSGSGDQTVLVWDAETGAVVAGPLQGHSSAVSSVVFSPDGKRVVSGSGDHTVRVWDAQTGALVAGPLQAHSSVVSSVAFSPDGNRIASGSFDKTILVWDAETDAVITGPFEGHSSWVTSVAFAPDGNRIVSGSYDRTIRTWDAETSTVIAGSFEGHSSSVSSVAFLPDGKRIVSGSGDQLVLVWDAETGALIAGPFEGRGHWVYSVAFSPDGNRIISGSADRKIRMWDAETGAVVASPFEGHSDWVRSVAFSPDGKRIVSGSKDGLIRLWDAVACENQVWSSFHGHA